MNTLANTLSWFKIALAKPTNKNVHTQLGVHFEEVAEMLTALGSHDPETANLLESSLQALQKLSTHLKQQDDVLLIVSRIDLLDAIADQLVTLTGSAHVLNMNIVGALNEVNDSNFSKFEEGVPVFDENQKIKKGRYYHKPNLEPYV